MSKTQHNYSAAFLQYLEGRAFEEIAENAEIPIELLRNHAAHEGWGGLRVVHTELHENQLIKSDAKHCLVKIEENREINLKQARKLQGAIDHALKQLQDEIQFGPKSYTVTTTDKKGNTKTETKIFERITPKNLRDIGCAIATVQDLTYRALGDTPAKKDPNQSDVAPRAQIVVNLPAIIAQPRDLTRVIEIANDQDSPQIVEERPISVAPSPSVEPKSE